MLAIRNVGLFVLVAVFCGALYAQPEIDVEYPVGTPLPSGSNIDLGDNPDRNTQTVTIRIANSGTTDLTLTGGTGNFVQASGAVQVNYTIQQPATGVITAGNGINLNIDVTPNADGGWQLSITIPNDDSDEGVYSFLIKGTSGKKKKDEDCSTGEGSGYSLLMLLAILSASLATLRMYRSRA